MHRSTHGISLTDVGETMLDLDRHRLITRSGNAGVHRRPLGNGERGAAHEACGHTRRDRVALISLRRRRQSARVVLLCSALRPAVSQRRNVSRAGGPTMLTLSNQVSSVAQVIQLAVAPVFLLAGVGALLGVLANRLGRVIDRFHVLEKLLADGLQPPDRAQTLRTIVSLSRRARMIHWAISLCVACELLICLVVAALFIGAEMQIELSRLIAALFVAAMLALIAGLACFLREIALATSVIENLGRTAARADRET